MAKKSSKKGPKVALDKRYVGHGTKEGFGPIAKGGKGKAKAHTSGNLTPHASKYKVKGRSKAK